LQASIPSAAWDEIQHHYHAASSELFMKYNFCRVTPQNSTGVTKKKLSDHWFQTVPLGFPKIGASSYSCSPPAAGAMDHSTTREETAETSHCRHPTRKLGVSRYELALTETRLIKKIFAPADGT
jgi:hypothetical protein